MRQCFALNMSGNLLVLSVPKAQTTSSRCKNMDILGISIDCILTAGSGITSYDGKGKSLSCIQLFMTPWTIHSVEFSRPEYWSGQPFPSLGNLTNPGTEPRSPALQVDSLPVDLQGKPKNTGVGSYPFSSKSSLPRNQSQVSCMAAGFYLFLSIPPKFNIYF